MIQVTCSLLKTGKTVIKTHLIPPVTLVTVKTFFICKAQKNILTGVLLQKNKRSELNMCSVTCDDDDCIKAQNKRIVKYVHMKIFGTHYL